MLGYEADVHELAPTVTVRQLEALGELPYGDRLPYLGTLISRTVAHVPYRTWVDHLLEAAAEGRARILHDGGYPFLFHAPGEVVKANFASADVEEISSLANGRWYLVEAWDQS